MNYRIAICDDNKTDAHYVTNILMLWSKTSGNEIDIQSFCSAESFLFHYQEDKNFDILLLDIEMQGMDGVTLAKEIRRNNETVQIVFITGYSDYIAEGYDVSALHYLIKPVQEANLFSVLDRATQKIRTNEQVIFLQLSDEVIRLPIYEIRYLEVQQNYVTVYAKQKYTIKKTLREFEEELDERFYRMGRSYLVNLHYIRRVSKKEVTLTDDCVIPLPRGQFDPLNRAIISHT